MMTDRLLTDCCYGTNDQHEPTTPCPQNDRIYNRPVCKEIILAALAEAHPNPMRVKQLRPLVVKGLGRRVHPKTPGMTLQRLADAGLVRNVGHDWYAK